MAILVISVVFVPGIVVAQDDGGPPALPAAYYGDVTVNGEPAPVGTEITAIVNGDAHGSIEVTEAGSYGGPDALDEKLVVSDATDGDEVSFVVRGVEAEETVVWKSEDVREVDLTFEGVPEESDGGSTGGTTTGDDDGGDATAGGQPSDGTTTTTEQDSTDAVDDTGNTSETASLEEVSAAITTDPETNTARATFDENASVSEIEFETASVNGTVSVVEHGAVPVETGSSPGTPVVVTDIEVPDAVSDQSATIEVQISNTELESIDASPDELRVYRYANDEWQSLETDVSSENADGVVLEAQTPGFSYFSVSAVGEPEAVLEIVPESIESGADVTLDGSGSEDSHGDIVSYQWSVADRELTGETATLTVDEPGEYDVELVVTNDAGERDTATGTLVVSESETGTTAQETDSQDGTTEAIDAGDDGAGGVLGDLQLTWILGALAVVVVVTLGVVVTGRGDDTYERL